LPEIIGGSELYGAESDTVGDGRELSEKINKIIFLFCKK
jgi:hypothetical protein